MGFTRGGGGLRAAAHLWAAGATAAASRPPFGQTVRTVRRGGYRLTVAQRADDPEGRGTPAQRRLRRD